MSMASSARFFFFNDTATTEIYTLSLHDALPICVPRARRDGARGRAGRPLAGGVAAADRRGDRKSTRLNSSHLVISYAVFCLKKKKRGRLAPGSSHKMIRTGGWRGSSGGTQTKPH